METLVTLTARDAKELEKIPHIREVLTLCHIMNTILSGRTFILRGAYEDLPLGQRDRGFFLLSTSSYVYEGILKTFHILKKFMDQLPKERQPDFVLLRSEVSGPRSFWKTVLKPIRNELVFHFSNVLASAPFAITVGQYPPVLSIGTTATNIEAVYSLPDDYDNKLPCNFTS
jgi:hypothetical protein